MDVKATQGRNFLEPQTTNNSVVDSVNKANDLSSRELRNNEQLDKAAKGFELLPALCVYSHAKFHQYVQYDRSVA